MSAGADRRKCAKIDNFERDFSENVSIVTEFTNGRLGNQMSSYATLLGAGWSLGLRPMMVHDNYLLLSKYFKNISMDIIEEQFCDHCRDITFWKLPLDSSVELFRGGGYLRKGKDPHLFR